MAAIGKSLEVAPGPAAEIQDRERPLALDGLQQRRNILADIMVAGALPEILGTPVVMVQRVARYLLQLLRIECHGRQVTPKRIAGR